MNVDERNDPGAARIVVRRSATRRANPVPGGRSAGVKTRREHRWVVEHPIDRLTVIDRRWRRHMRTALSRARGPVARATARAHQASKRRRGNRVTGRVDESADLLGWWRRGATPTIGASLQDDRSGSTLAALVGRSASAATSAPPAAAAAGSVVATAATTAATATPATTRATLITRTRTDVAVNGRDAEESRLIAGHDDVTRVEG